jgi:hypothetical protein
MTKDVCIAELVTLNGYKTTIIDLMEYDGIEYAKVSYRGILIPLTAIWRTKENTLIVS